MFNGETESRAPPALDNRRDRRVKSVEVVVFLFLIVPSLVLSLFVVREGNLDFSISALATIFRDLALVCIILYFLWRNGEPVDCIGWTAKRIGREVLLGIVLFPPVYLCTALLDKFLIGLGLTGPSKTLPPELHAGGGGQMVLAVVLVMVVAVAEETVFRGYLLLRFRPHFGNVGAVVLSSVIFAVGHGYEGSAGLATVGVMGAVFAVIYLLRGSLVAPMVMHFLQDFLGIVLLPLLGVK